MSVPAQGACHTHPRRDIPADVPLPISTRDRSGLIAAAALRSDLSDRQLRLYVVLVTVFDRGVSAAQVAKVMGITEAQAARVLGDLTSAGLLTARRRTIAYRAGDARVRRREYTLIGGDL